MKKFWKQFRIVVPAVLVLVLAAAAVFAPLTARRSFPQMDGEIQIEGLAGPVDIIRDSYGIPHIYAASLQDLFFAQGYVHAQDRFWQMDFWRHIGSGRLSEMFGDAQLETDRFLRTLGWARVAQQELQSLDSMSVTILSAYSEGINAYIKDRKGADVSLEYVILGLLNPDYVIEPWQPLHSMTWAKAMAWDLRGNMDEEIDRSILLKTLSPEQVADLYPAYPDDHPIIVPSPALSKNAPLDVQGSRMHQETTQALLRISDHVKILGSLLGPHGSGIGSNSWTISGRLTNTGLPYLANDPHLGVQMPSIWYEIGLHCAPVSEECPFDVAGYSFAGDPGVIIGHNNHIAWGFTNVGPDVMDLYIEKINPDNPNQYEVNGEWVDMELVQETIQIAGVEPVEHTVRYTRHGPVLSDVQEELTTFDAVNGQEIPEKYAVALRWTALEPSNTFPAIWRINRAQNWDEFRQAASYFDVPSQNLVYADVEGNIGYQTPGKIPVRASGDGFFPVPGWTDQFEWTGYIPFEEMPFSLNPPQGYIATANNAVVSSSYPYMISKEWDYGYRAQRIVELLSTSNKPIDIATIQSFQGDNKALNAEFTVPFLLGLPLEDEKLLATRQILKDWDYQAHMDSAPAALYQVYWKNLLFATFNDQLPEDFWPGGGSRWFEIMRKLVNDPDNPWWDNVNTANIKENRDQTMLQAFSSAVSETETLLGSNVKDWKWGKLHSTVFRNSTLGQSGIAPIEALFNRGPFLTSGGESIINATGWNATADQPYEVDWLPSMRMIVDLSNLQNSLAVNTTGQSGHAYHPHYIDMADLWRNIQYHPMHWERQQVESNAEGYLTLIP